MRLFIGVWLSETMREEVVRYITRTRQVCSSYRWTSPENLHFTLKFLGEVSEDRLEQLYLALRSAAAENQTFKLKLGTTGYFLERGEPRIVWVGVSDGQAALVKLAQSVENCCFQQGFVKSDKLFQPHLTIARNKRDIPTGGRVSSIPIPESHFTSESQICGFSLIESSPTPTGPKYKSLKDFQCEIRS